MQGEKDTLELRGVIPNSFEHIFSHITNSRNEQYLVRAAFLEIYMVLFLSRSLFLPLSKYVFLLNYYMDYID